MQYIRYAPAAAFGFFMLMAPCPILADEPKPSLPELLKLYSELGLPLPPRNARLVRDGNGGGRMVDGVIEPKWHSLAFEIKARTGTEPPIILIGASRYPFASRIELIEVEPTREVAEGALPDLLLAIQCHSRGWDDLAKALYAKSARAQEPISPRQELMQSAWSYWTDELDRPKTNRAEIASRLRDLMDRDSEFDTERSRELLRCIALTLIPSRAAQGSVEALVDGLIDYTGTMGGWEPRGNKRNAQFARIAILGFEAVPALIDHLDDDRLTRSEMRGFNNFFPFNLRVRHIVSDLLEGLAGQELDFDWLRRQQGWTVDKAEIDKWWAKAKVKGEEAYLIEHFLDGDGSSGGGRDARIMEERLLILNAKYPRRIQELYRTLLDKRPDVPSPVLARAVYDSTLPANDKTALFLHAMENKNRRHHLPALAALKILEPSVFEAALRQSIESLPGDTPEAYSDSPIPRIAALAIRSKDPQIWPVLEKVVHRSSLGLKMEILLELGNARYLPKTNLQRRRALTLMAQYLDDESIRDNASDKRLQGLGRCSSRDQFELRDSVALDMGRILGIDQPEYQEANSLEWPSFRRKVREAAEAELRDSQ